MSEEELKRRQVHGVLSSKSLLESLERLTLNKSVLVKNSAKSKKPEDFDINYSITNKLSQYLHVQDNLVIKADGK